MRATFEQLVEPYRGRLRLHCYRMLGSTSDADDLVQESMARAFRSRHTLEDDAMVRPWLYRIATNLCLDELKARTRRARGPEMGPESDPDAPPAAATPDDVWIEPMPSTWLQEAASDPASAYTVKESVALAFIAALQVLTPAQRAVLLLREVVGLTAEESAAALEISASAASSLLHRAREALNSRVGPRAQWSPDAASPVDPALLQRYVRVWETSDLEAIIALLHEDVVLSMPPSPTWLRGRDAVARFFAHRVRDAVASRLFRTLELGANGRPAVGYYRRANDGQAHFFALQVLEFHEGAVRTIDHFMAASAHLAFFRAGLPKVISPEADRSAIDLNRGR